MALVNSIPRHLITLLVNLGLGSYIANDTNWPIFAGKEPFGDDVPEECITLYDIGGGTQGHLQPTSKVVNNPGIQIRVRAYNEANAFTKISAIAEALASINRVETTVDSETIRFDAITERGTPLSLGEIKDTDLFVYVYNISVTYTKIS